MKIVKVTVLTGGATGCDEIFLETDLPSGVFPYSQPASVTLHVVNGEGEAYARKHFPLEPEVISLK